MKYTNGNLLDAATQAYVNTVNTVGVMGKGIALQFREAFPVNYKLYVDACKNGEVRTGKMFVVKEETMQGPKIIVNFPTKREWFAKSKYEYIEEGLKDLVRVLGEDNIQSIAIPPLGCGNGGLKWDKVKSLMEQYLGPIRETEIYIYEPTDAIKEILKAKESTKSAHLTDARALLLYALFYYESIGEESNLFVANKLAYFFQRLGETSMVNLRFERGTFGPYSAQVVHMLYGINGTYIKGLEQLNVKAFEPLELQYEKAQEVSGYVKNNLTSEQQDRLKNLLKLIDGFQSSLSLEILATVDFLKKENPKISQEEAIKEVQTWSERKKHLFKDRYIEIAYKHLKEVGSQFQIV